VTWDRRGDPGRAVEKKGWKVRDTTNPREELERCQMGLPFDYSLVSLGGMFSYLHPIGVWNSFIEEF
jgi:hypothetical protein